MFLCSRKQKERYIMTVFGITKEDAIARFRRSLEIKRAAEQRIAEQWAREGITGTIVSL